MINVWNGKWSIDNGSQNTSHEWVSVCVCECVSLCVCGWVCFCVFLLDSVRISDLLSVGFWNFGSFLRVWYTMQLWHAIPCAPYLRAINQGVYTIFLWKISYRRWFEAFLEILPWKSAIGTILNGFSALILDRCKILAKSRMAPF